MVSMEPMRPEWADRAHYLSSLSVGGGCPPTPLTPSSSLSAKPMVALLR